MLAKGLEMQHVASRAEKPPQKRVLYVGTTWHGSTTVQRRHALEFLGYEVDTVDTGWRQEIPLLGQRLLRSFWRRIGYPRELMSENKKIVDSVTNRHYAVLWVDKGLTIRPETLAFVRHSSPETVLASFSVDDMSNPQNQSRYYLKCVSQYDLHVTTKTHNYSELKNMGARRVCLIDNGYDPSTHRSVKLTEKDREAYSAEVGFVGGYEEERAATLLKLARAGIPVRVWGNRWHKLRKRPNFLKIEGRPVFGDEYAKVLCATKINLAFLRKVNRDHQTTRSVEIPACSAFMLAERTEEHQKLFREDEEAAFFENDQELSEKIKYYLKAHDERQRIAQAGRRRCLISGYSNQERFSPILKICEQIKPSQSILVSHECPI